VAAAVALVAVVTLEVRVVQVIGEIRLVWVALAMQLRRFLLLERMLMVLAAGMEITA
jgi:hypothetical protein